MKNASRKGSTGGPTKVTAREPVPTTVFDSAPAVEPAPPLERDFKTGIQEAIHLLSTNTTTTLGRYCSAATLSPVSAPPFSMTLYIAALQSRLIDGTTGTYEEGVEEAIQLLEDYRLVRSPDDPTIWVLVPVDENTSVTNQLYISALERILNPDG